MVEVWPVRLLSHAFKCRLPPRIDLVGFRGFESGGLEVNCGLSDFVFFYVLLLRLVGYFRVDFNRAVST